MGRLLIAVGYLAGTGVWLLYSVVLNALRCDDSCTSSANARGWNDIVDSWQWRAILVCGVLGALAALAVVLLTMLRLALPAVAALAGHAAAMSYVVSLVGSAGRLGDTAPFVTVAGLIAGGGLALVLLSRKRPATIAS